MYFLHGFPGVLHRDQSFLIYVRGLDGGDLLLEHADLTVRLLQGVLVLLFSF